MDDLLERIAALTRAAKVAILAAVLLVTGAAYYAIFYSSLLDERVQIKTRETQLRKEKSEYEARRKQFLAYQNEVNSLLDQQKELLRVLPRKDDIEQFIESVNAQVEAAGLTRVSYVREAPLTEDLYLRLPIKMSAVGTYHQFNRFFKTIGDLQRIVTIGNLQLKRAELKDKEKEVGAGQPLQAEFIATTFQLLDRSARPAAATATGAKR